MPHGLSSSTAESSVRPAHTKQNDGADADDGKNAKHDEKPHRQIAFAVSAKADTAGHPDHNGAEDYVYAMADAGQEG